MKVRMRLCIQDKRSLILELLDGMCNLERFKDFGGDWDTLVEELERGFESTENIKVIL